VQHWCNRTQRESRKKSSRTAVADGRKSASDSVLQSSYPVLRDMVNLGKISLSWKPLSVWTLRYVYPLIGMPAWEGVLENAKEKVIPLSLCEISHNVSLEEKNVPKARDFWEMGNWSLSDFSRRLQQQKVSFCQRIRGQKWRRESSDAGHQTDRLFSKLGRLVWFSFVNDEQRPVWLQIKACRTTQAMCLFYYTESSRFTS
jgi:hypothetical protein